MGNKLAEYKGIVRKQSEAKKDGGFDFEAIE